MSDVRGTQENWGSSAANGASSGPIAPWAGGGAPTPDERRWLVLGVIAIAQLMIVLDATIMNIALPSAQHALHFSLVDRQWVVTAYALSFGSLLLLGGKLADLVGRKATFLTGLAGFAVASAVGGAASNFTMLVSARAAQGAFAALLAPSALSLLATLFTDPGERRRAFGVYGAVAGAGGAVGLLLGGVLTQYLSWRWCLYVNLAFAVVAGLGAATLLRAQSDRRNTRLDLPGALLVSGGMFGIVYGFSNAANHSWGVPTTWGFLAAGGAALVAFVLWQSRASQPLLPLRVLADRSRGAAYMSTLISGAGMFGVLLFLNYYMQQDLHFSPVKTGLAFLPMVALTMIFTNVANVGLMPRTGPRPLVTIGMLLAAGSALWLAQLGAKSAYATGILPAIVLVGAGLGFIFAPAADTGTAGVPPRDTGVASATLNTGNQLGGSIGTSLLNTIFAGAITSYIVTHTAVHHRTTAHVASLAVLHAYSTAFWWTAGIYLGGAIVAVLLMRSGPLPQATSTETSRPGTSSRLNPGVNAPAGWQAGSGSRQPAGQAVV